MIVSASRRTDIPAFYSDWFIHRLQEGFVLVRNPMNMHQISKINLQKKVVDCFVFWTKNPKQMLNKLNMLEDYNFYFQFTLNAYGHDVEANLPAREEIIGTFTELSRRIGKNRLIWRYDPIALTDIIDQEYHCRQFEYLANRLSPHTHKCIISFIDLYRNTRRNVKHLNIREMTDNEMREIARRLKTISDKYDLPLESCAEEIELKDLGIEHGRCIDDKLISKITGYEIDVQKDPVQREACGCVASIDIGSYNTCGNNCLYCYANYNRDLVIKNMRLHDQYSPLLFGNVTPDDRITDRKMYSCKVFQQGMFKLER